jgi:hypothetical protein
VKTPVFQAQTARQAAESRIFGLFLTLDDDFASVPTRIGLVFQHFLGVMGERSSQNPAFSA